MAGLPISIRKIFIEDNNPYTNKNQPTNNRL